MKFGMVDVATWDDEAFAALDTDARLLFLWSFTCREATICGLYTTSLRAMGRAIATPPDSTAAWRELEDRVFAALEQLAVKPVLLYDDNSEVVWVVNRARHANRSPKTAAAMRREFVACPPSPLRDQFAQAYGDALGLPTEVR
jgi:hypothetical protein